MDANVQKIIGVRERVARPDVAAVELRTKKVVATEGQMFYQLPRSWELWEQGIRLARWEFGKVVWLYMKDNASTAVVA